MATYTEIFWRTVDEGADPIVISKGTLTHLVTGYNPTRTLCGVTIPYGGAYFGESHTPGDCQRCLNKKIKLSHDCEEDPNFRQTSYGSI
jgi:hypothetical protein